MKKILLTLAILMVGSNVLAYDYTVENKTSKSVKVEVTPVGAMTQSKDIGSGLTESFSFTKLEAGACLDKNSLKVDGSKVDVPGLTLGLRCFKGADYILNEENGKIEVSIK